VPAYPINGNNLLDAHVILCYLLIAVTGLALALGVVVVSKRAIEFQSELIAEPTNAPTTLINLVSNHPFVSDEANQKGILLPSLVRMSQLFREGDPIEAAQVHFSFGSDPRHVEYLRSFGIVEEPIVEISRQIIYFLVGLQEELSIWVVPPNLRRNLSFIDDPHLILEIRSPKFDHQERSLQLLKSIDTPYCSSRALSRVAQGREHSSCLQPINAPLKYGYARLNDGGHRNNEREPQLASLDTRIVIVFSLLIGGLLVGSLGAYYIDHNWLRCGCSLIGIALIV